jgi:HAD superfamily hydrolase (TIGR01450 family)
MPSLAAVRAFLLDMDGTLVVDERLLPGALELIELLRRGGRRLLFLTNNSSARASDYRLRLEQLGIPACDDEVLTSGEATWRYLLRETSHRRPYLLGTPALQDEFRDAGLPGVEDQPDCVVLGFDKTLTYERLARASLLVARGLPYFATHADFTCITGEGLIPDTGAFIAAIQTVTGRRPKVLGKPEPEMVAAALERLGTSAAETAMVGDQLDTDMTMAQRAGLLGVLVLSGETSRERLEAQREVRPDLVLTSVAELVGMLRSA